MKKYKYTGKTKEEAISLAKEELNLTEGNYFVEEQEVKKGLFKGKSVEIEIIKKEDIIDFIKEYLKELTKNMGLDVNIESKSAKDTQVITLYSDNNNILIGKNGRTLDALNTIVKQAVKKETGLNYKFLLDVGEYKVKQQRSIERLAKQTAREVAKTKIEAKMDPMNSYERRLVHSILNDSDKVYTESEGEEPNRYVVIKPRD